jgi:hypothetical protein
MRGGKKGRQAVLPSNCLWGKKILGELILPLNPVFVSPMIATEVFNFIYILEVFNFIYLLFISLQLPKINARHGREAF